eukprot:CAMPEP_0180427030 /NCGR_PEP_ID=MMETSP1036_2-20121128/6103_1 /TAXON_ID=632150 /ORGANISM="Azadinium spinosum, Strain 3D9" /LENGTH=88 /DNA_ID=CAMNT_0022432607 /DNA_START=522 /DNA_END=789 /DNA_ORIENTATION=+
MAHADGVPKLMDDGPYIINRLTPSHVQGSLITRPRVAYTGRAAVQVGDGHAEARPLAALNKTDTRQQVNSLIAVLNTRLRSSSTLRSK